MKETVIFTKKKRVYPNQKTPSIRVTRELFINVAEIADEAGVSVQEVASRLIAFALKHVKVIDEKGEAVHGKNQ